MFTLLFHVLCTFKSFSFWASSGDLNSIPRPQLAAASSLERIVGLNSATFGSRCTGVHFQSRTMQRTQTWLYTHYGKLCSKDYSTLSHSFEHKYIDRLFITLHLSPLFLIPTYTQLRRVLNSNYVIMVYYFGTPDIFIIQYKLFKFNKFSKYF